jgi:ankyrin repeat protein
MERMSNSKRFSCLNIALLVCVGGCFLQPWSLAQNAAVPTASTPTSSTATSAPAPQTSGFVPPKGSNVVKTLTLDELNQLGGDPFAAAAKSSTSTAKTQPPVSPPIPTSTSDSAPPSSGFVPPAGGNTVTVMTPEELKQLGGDPFAAGAKAMPDASAGTVNASGEDAIPVMPFGNNNMPNVNVGKVVASKAAQATRKPSKTQPATPPEGLAEPKYPTLLEAVKAGDVADVENHIQRGEDFQKADASGFTPLHHAVIAGSLPVMELLLDYGANPWVGALPDRLSSPMYYALQQGRMDMSALLRSFGGGTDIANYACHGDIEGMKAAIEADPSCVIMEDALKMTPLHKAAGAGQLESVKYLMSLGADPSAGDLEGMTPFFLAGLSNKGDVVKYMVGAGVNVDGRIRDGYTLLHVKAKQGDSGLIDLLLSLGADINAKSVSGLTPLHVAVMAQKKEMASLLLEKGALIYAADNKGRTPLHVAAEGGLGEMCLLLLDKGADLASQDKSGASPLHLAAREAQTGAVDALLSRGADVNACDRRGQTPLHVDVMEDRPISPEKLNPNAFPPAPFNQTAQRLAILEKLLAKGANIEEQTKVGTTPLHIAAASGQDTLVTLLLDKGAKLEARENNGRTPLFSALLKNQQNAAKILINRGADINAKDGIEQIPLHVASEAAKSDIVEILLLKGTSVNAADRNKWTPLHSAADKGALTVGQLLIANGADVRAADVSGRTPLHIAAQRGDVQWAKMLIANGADVNMKDNSGRSPVHCAAWEGHWGPVQVFIGEGADINATDAKGYTAMHIAADHGHVRMVKLLLARGANPNLRNNDGKTPLGVAQQLNKEEVVALLRPTTESSFMKAIAAGDKETVKNFLDDDGKLSEVRVDGLTPLHIACRDGKKEIVETLLSHGADIAAAEKNYEGMTGLHEAALAGHKEIVELLLAMGADVNQADRRGRTPLDRAASKGKTEIVNLLRDRGATSSVGVPRGSEDQIASLLEKEEFKGRLHSLLNNTLMVSVIAGDLENVKKALDANPSVINIKFQGKTALHLACSLGKEEIAVELVKRGADVNVISDKDGTNPIQEAAKNGFKPIVDLLLANGADPYAKNKIGKNSLELATEHHHQEIATVIRVHMGLQ